jgi:hypothetical protein
MGTTDRCGGIDRRASEGQFGARAKSKKPGFKAQDAEEAA